MGGYDSRIETYQHIQKVQSVMCVIIKNLIDRQLIHDQSKLSTPEKEIFDKHIGELKNLTYGSTEYYENLEKMQDALDHHYRVNPHHPEFYTCGVQGMDLLDIMEMFADWMAAADRQVDKNDGGDVKNSMKYSIEHNQGRFGYSDDLKQIFLNTLDKVQKD